MRGIAPAVQEQQRLIARGQVQADLLNQFPRQGALHPAAADIQQPEGGRAGPAGPPR